jgi:hypothetical protein
LSNKSIDRSGFIGAAAFRQQFFSIQLGMQFKQAHSSLWDGMVVHFINNASVNFFHVVLPTVTESIPTMRIAIAQTILFVIVSVRWFLWKKEGRERSGGAGQNQQQAIAVLW